MVYSGLMTSPTNLCRPNGVPACNMFKDHGGDCSDGRTRELQYVEDAVMGLLVEASETLAEYDNSYNLMRFNTLDEVLQLINEAKAK